MGFPELKQDHPGQYAFLERMVAATAAVYARVAGTPHAADTASLSARD